MALRPSLQFLRPRARLIVSPASRDAFVSFYSAARSVKSRRTLPGHPTSDAHTYSTKALTDDEKRIKELQDAEALKYPRIRPDRNAISCAEFRTRYASLSLKESRDSDTVTLRGTFLMCARLPACVADCDREASLLENCGVEIGLS